MTLTIKTIPKDELASYIGLSLKRKGLRYNFSFMFYPRLTQDDFVLTYPADQFPPNKSIEILISDMPEELKTREHNSVHIATNKSWSPDEHYICYYPGKNRDEALEIAKFWARYNLMYLETGNTSTDKEVVAKFELDEDIEVIEIS